MEFVTADSGLIAQTIDYIRAMGLGTQLIAGAGLIACLCRL